MSTQLASRFLKMGHIQHIHFVGVGGVGMAGIAEVILGQGYRVSGSDQAENALTKRLRELGADIFMVIAQKILKVPMYSCVPQLLLGIM